MAPVHRRTGGWRTGLQRYRARDVPRGRHDLARVARRTSGHNSPSHRNGRLQPGKIPPGIELEDPSITYYRASPGTMFPVPLESDRLITKAQVSGPSVWRRSKGIRPGSPSVETPVVNDTLGGADFVIVTDSEARAARAYERGARTFSFWRERRRGGREREQVGRQEKRPWCRKTSQLSGCPGYRPATPTGSDGSPTIPTLPSTRASAPPVSLLAARYFIALGVALGLSGWPLNAHASQKVPHR